MPRPRSGESEQEYVSRFMGSDEARKDYPDEKQRAAVAYSLWKHRENTNAKDWPKLYSCRFIEPGLCKYQDLDHPILLRKEALDKMAKSFVGKPVINEVHKTNLKPENFERDAEGAVTRVWYNSDDGWYWGDFLVWDETTQRNCESKAYSVSCAYKWTEADDAMGEHHNMKYEGEVLNGEYTHLAIVRNPRYEGARIICNSKGDNRMKLRFWPFGKEAKNATDLDLDKTTVEVDGKEVTMQELLNSHAIAEKAKAEAAAKPELKNMADDTVIEADGKTVTLGELKNSYREKLNADEKAKKDEEERKNADEKEKKEKEEKEKMNAAEAKKKEDEEKERQNAIDKTKKEDADKHFKELKNKADLRGDPQQPRVITQREQAEEGARRYGSGK